MIAPTPDYFAGGVLDQNIHARLVQDIDAIARDANIPKKYIFTPLADYADADVIEWVKRYPTWASQGVYGLCYIGGDATASMMGVAGAFTRNFIRAQVVPLSDLIEGLKQGLRPEASVLIIPNFYMPSKQGGGLTAQQTMLLWSFMQSRMMEEKQTVIHISNLASLGAEYGQQFVSFLENHFARVGA